MTIGWGKLGIEWNRPIFIAYVRESRYTKQMLEANGEFTVNIPIDGCDPQILKFCGIKSGRDTDKIRELGLTLEPSECISVPGIKELPLTLQCRVLFRNVQDETKLPKSIKQRFYSAINAWDYHIAYYAEIVGAYIAE